MRGSVPGARATIPPQTPRPETLQASESNRISALTENNVFQAAIQQGQDERLFLVLDRLAG